jgi:hypothetical protein
MKSGCDELAVEFASQCFLGGKERIPAVGTLNDLPDAAVNTALGRSERYDDV